MVGLICLTNSDFGPMRTAEERAQHGDLGAVDGSSEKQVQPAERGTVWDMLLPIGSLIVFAVLGLLYSGGYWGKDPAFHTMGAAFGNCTAAKALVWASVGALTVSFLLFVPRGLLSFRTFMDGAVEGMKAMLPANIILVLAWTISGVCRDLRAVPCGGRRRIRGVPPRHRVFDCRLFELLHGHGMGDLRHPDPDHRPGGSGRRSGSRGGFPFRDPRWQRVR